VQIDITKASSKQHADIGTAKGLTVNYRLGPEKLVEALRVAGWTEDYIDVDAVEATSDSGQQTTVEAEAKVEVFTKPKAERVDYGVNDNFPMTGIYDSEVTLIISASGDKGGEKPVKVAVNGVAMLLPRDKVIKVPFRYYEALLHAVRLQYDPSPDGIGTEPARRVPAHPFQVIAGAPSSISGLVA
jgi:hypothetical protein